VSPTVTAKAAGLDALGLSPEPNAPLLELVELITHFRVPDGEVHAVDGVSLRLERGQTIGIVGESGSGKTVLSRSAMGLLHASNVIQKGEVRYEGHDINALADKDRRKLWGTEMAMVFQDPMTSLNPVMKIGRQIGESLRYHLGMSKGEARDAAIAGLASVGIPAPERRVDEYPHQLSGGMRQRVTIAIALACGPKLLFADEPTTALDVTVQAQILDLLSHQQRERNMGMMLVTHDLGVVAGRADVVAVMYAGQVVELARTEDLFGRVLMPYTEALLRAIPKLDEPSHTKLNVITGRPPDLVHPPTGCRFAPRCQYVQELCRKQAPPLVESGTPGHYYRCWFPVNSPASETSAETTAASVTTKDASAPGPEATTDGKADADAKTPTAPAAKPGEQPTDEEA
jgi:peptide/nickel transport system ATP-binding protein